MARLRFAFAPAVLLAVLLGGGACASSKSSSPSPSSASADAPGVPPVPAPAPAKKKKDTGIKILRGVVVEREREAPGEGGSNFQGTGSYYLIFEVHEGEATARYRYPVTQQQWFRYPEGSPVRITLRNNFLQDIKPDTGS
ncbi:MAG TPA: hypothetical protein VGK26_11345 [Thermoanaerobaculia bacterium]|jgi:hypothetical protein